MQSLVHFKEFVTEINSSNSRLFKQATLKKYKDDQIIRRYLQIAFDPYTVYGISTKKLAKIVPGSGITTVQAVFELFDYLEKHNTGTDRDVSLCQELLSHVCTWDREAGAVLEALICKDLSIGVDSKTINKEMPGLIPTFDVMLANKYFDKPTYMEGKLFAITTKIDGGRIIALKENGQVSFFTRAGQKYEGLVDLEEEMRELMPDNTCLDGEITLFDRGDLSSKEAYKQTMKIVRQTTNPEKHGIKMLVFDWMPAEDFKKQECHYSYHGRREWLHEIFSNQDFTYFELLPILYCGRDTSKITEILEEQIAHGEEGIMINDYYGSYEFKRTNALLKVKKMQTLDLEIIDFEEGEGRLAGTLGAVLVRYKDGNVVKVGSGFSDQLRKEIWQNRHTHLGTICEIQYFEETTNADGGKSLRFPIFKDFRHDKLEADY